MRRQRPSAGSSRRAGCVPEVGLGLGQADELGPQLRVHPMVVTQQADRPAPDRGDGMVEQLHRDAVVEPAAGVESPEVAQGDRLVAIVVQQTISAAGRSHGSRRSARMRRASRGEPVVGAFSERDQLGARSFGQVKRGHLAALSVDDAVDPAVGAVPGVARVEMGSPLVVPVDDIDGRVRPDQEVDRPEPAVAGVDQGPAVPAGERRAVLLEHVPVDGVRQQVAADERAAERRRETRRPCR